MGNNIDKNKPKSGQQSPDQRQGNHPSQNAPGQKPQGENQQMRDRDRQNDDLNRKGQWVPPPSREGRF